MLQIHFHYSIFIVYTILLAYQLLLDDSSAVFIWTIFRLEFLFALPYYHQFKIIPAQNLML